MYTKVPKTGSSKITQIHLINCLSDLLLITISNIAKTVSNNNGNIKYIIAVYYWVLSLTNLQNIFVAYNFRPYFSKPAEYQ